MNDQGGPPRDAREEATPDVERLRREAEDARAELADSLQELKTRLSPSEMLAQTRTSVQEYAEHATASLAAEFRRRAEDVRGQVVRRGRDATRAIQQQPAAMAAVTAAAAGVVWYFSRERGPHSGNGHQSGVGRWSASSRNAPVAPPPRAGSVTSRREAGVSPATAAASGAYDPRRDDVPGGPGRATATDVTRAEGQEGTRAREKASSHAGRRVPAAWTTGAAAAIVTTAVLARRAGVAPSPGAGPSPRWEQAKQSARNTAAQATDATKAVARRLQAAAGSVSAAPSRLDAGAAAMIGTVLGLAAAMWLPRSEAEVRWSQRAQQSVRRSLISAGRRATDQAQRSFVPALAALLDSPSNRTHGH